MDFSREMKLAMILIQLVPMDVPRLVKSKQMLTVPSLVQVNVTFAGTGKD